MRYGNNIREVENLGIDWMGFIFYPKSSRYVSSLPDYLPENAQRVGVFVNESMAVIKEKTDSFQLHMVQLHGDETPQMCSELQRSGVKVIKAFNIGDSFPVEKVKNYEGVCDFFLFDTQTVQHGGSGRKFNWKVLTEYRGETPFLLSGGISMEDADDILRFAHPQFAGIDINSRFETAPAQKNSLLIQQFLEKTGK